MGEGFVINLVINAAILLALSVIYEIGHSLPAALARYRKVFYGLLIGVAVVSIMSVPFRMASDRGIVFDTRSILLFSAGMVFGPLPAAIGALAAVAFRLASGGTGMLTGVAVIITSTAMGIIMRDWIMAGRSGKRWLRCYLAGLANHVIMIACFFLIPMPAALDIVRGIAAPVLLIHPLVTVLLCIVLTHQVERNQALLKLADEESYYKSLFDDNHAIMLLVDQDDGRIADANAAASHFYGWSREQMCSMRISDINSLDDETIKDIFMTAFRQKKFPLLMQHRLADGQIRDVEVFSGPIKSGGRNLAYSIIHDVSDRIAMTAKLQQQQKLESIGVLAGGVAHEINNPITGIMNYAQLILDTTPDKSPAAEYAGEIVHESERISEIVKNLLQFSRQEKQSHSYASLGDIVNRTVSLINTIFRKDQIRLEVSLPEDLPQIKCRSQQIQQVLMNLLTNARDALNEKYADYAEDKLILSTGQVIEKDGQDWVRLLVEDHGPGIRDDIRNRIFDPFFSTKPKEKGTGLGLAISFGIVHDHHGSLTLESKVGEFTRFYLDLPVDNGW